MSVPAPSNPSLIYIGIIAGLVGLGFIGGLMRIIWVKQIRRKAFTASQNVLAAPAPPTLNLATRPQTQRSRSTPALAYSAPVASAPMSPSFNQNPTRPAPQGAIPTSRSQIQPQPPSDQLTANPSLQSTPLPPQPPDQVPADEPMSLLNRMRQVQTLMLEIHRLETASSRDDNRERIEELHRRVADLSDSQDPPPPRNTVAETREPQPYMLDDRID
ncbi:hypothetical protein GALMADRAFT_133933 [Galerina marginata CBS 339.88]|uniref:Uncharacterized protein n=1 Tax=Galerina marginata (strain CBS 339.88) TaxID=685588 RepID=A0A067TN86_GALM3|nr:hypothetical protein GALMADRAFT_133933 [Galerina marginata CBS 339.88]